MDGGASAELMEVAPCLTQDKVAGHGVRERVEENHEFVDVHLLLHRFLSVDGHDSDTDEEMKGGGLVVCPTSLPDSERVLLRELSLEADEEPAVAEHEGEPALGGVQVRVEPRQ